MEGVIVAIDPGKNNGVALFSADGTLRKWGVKDFSTMPEFFIDCMDIEVSAYIVEGFRLRKYQQASGDPMLSSQVIGMARLAASLTDAELVIQDPENRILGAMYRGIELPKGHTPDDLSAQCHGWFYLVTHGIVAAQTVD